MNDANGTTMSALRDARRRANLTAEVLAERAGVTVGWLRTVERAPGLMSSELAARLAAVLRVNPAALIPRRARAAGIARRMVF